MLKIFPSTSIQRKLLFIETLLNTTDKVSKVSPHSVLDGVAEGVAKVAGKAEKDIVLSISQLFPDNASSIQLDQVAKNFGIAPRFGAIGSSTYVRLVADPNTEYLKNTHQFLSTSGIRFELAENVTVGQYGFIYAKVQSLEIGSSTNVEPLTINNVVPAPIGHQYVINEYKAIGGRDIEDDETFRRRLKEGANILARNTLSMLEQLFISINPNVLRVMHQGYRETGKIRLGVASQNGASFSPTELNQLLQVGRDYFALTEYRPFGSNFSGIELNNIEYEYIDISFRVDLDSAFDPDTVRQNIQINIAKYMDFRFWDSAKSRVEWDNILEIIKRTPGVRYVPDQYFYPRYDLFINTYKLPRLRGFLMLDLNGSIIANFTNTLSPVYYPNQSDFSYQATILRRL